MSAMPGPGGVTEVSRRSRKPGVIVLGAGVAILIAAVLLIAVRVGPGLVETFAGVDSTTPHTEILDLDRGSYVVFELVGRGRNAYGVTFTTMNPPRLHPADVRVTGANGAVLLPRSTSFTQTLDLGDKHYVGVAEFDVSVAGEYTVSIDRPVGVTFVVAPSLGSTFQRAIPGVLVGVVGVVVFIAGLVMIVLASRRRPVAAVHTLPAAGWYPDPARPGGLRWWDGQRWGPWSA